MITLKLNELSRRLYLCIKMYMCECACTHTQREREIMNLRSGGKIRVREGEKVG